jgi:hypothetical protein
LGRGRDEQGYGIGNDFNADGKLAEDFSVGLGGDAVAEPVAWAAVDRIGADEMDVAGEGMAAEKDRHQEAEVIEAAARLERDEMKTVAVEGGSWGEVAEHTSKTAHANGKELRDLLDVGHARAVGEGRLKEREGVGGPDAEGFNEVEEIAEAALEGRIHAGKKESVSANARGYSEVTRTDGVASAA